MKIIIKEVIVVEGRDDISAVKAAVDAEVISVNGYCGKKKEKLGFLQKAYENNGLIIFTDPDHAGEQIRRAINERFPNSKNAYITKKEGIKADDIGVENADPEAIVRALLACKVEVLEKKEEEIFTIEDLIDNNLVGGDKAKENREALGFELSIGYSNAKQLLSKLNKYKISREEFLKAVEKVNNK